MNRIKMLLVMFVLISLVVAITSSVGWSPVLPRWSWCVVGCTDDVVRVLLNGKERIDAVYFPTGATIVAPVEGEVTLAMIWWSPFKIFHRGETKSPEYFWYVELMGDTNTPYLLAGWSDHPPEILVPEEVWVEWHTPIIYAEKEGFVGCYKYKGNNKDLARYFPTDWVPCDEGDP